MQQKFFGLNYKDFKYLFKENCNLVKSSLPIQADFVNKSLCNLLKCYMLMNLSFPLRIVDVYKISMTIQVKGPSLKLSLSLDFCLTWAQPRSTNKSPVWTVVTCIIFNFSMNLCWEWQSKHFILPLARNPINDLPSL